MKLLFQLGSYLCGQMLPNAWIWIMIVISSQNCILRSVSQDMMFGRYKANDKDNYLNVVLR